MLDEILFTIVALGTGLGAVGVVFARNIVRQAVCLLFTLIGISMLYFLLGAEFVGATQLIVYVGGTMVLVIFGVMLTARQEFVTIRATPVEWFTAGLLGLGLFTLLAKTLPALESNASEQGQLPSTGPIGVALLTKYLLPFEAISLHLLVVLIGAAYLARAKKRPSDLPKIPLEKEET